MAYCGLMDPRAAYKVQPQFRNVISQARPGTRCTRVPRFYDPLRPTPSVISPPKNFTDVFYTE